MPHGYCLEWRAPLIAFHVLGDLGGIVPYPLLALGLELFVRRRPLGRRLLGLSRWCQAFLVGCGLTHLDGVALIWAPWYWWDGWVKVAMGTAACVATVRFVRLLPELRAADAEAHLRAVVESIESGGL